MTSGGGYTNKSLVGNWYEDRQAPEQLCKKYAEERYKRERENEISNLTASGLPKPLGTIKRVHKWNTEGIIPDDGFRDMTTINRTEIPDVRIVQKQLQQPSKLLDQTSGQTRSLINKDNIARLTHVNRELQGPQTGFGSILPRHGADHEQRRFDTTYNSVHGSAAQQVAPHLTGTGFVKPQEKEVDHFTTTKQLDFNYDNEGFRSQAGATYQNAFQELRGTQKQELLVGEQFRHHDDPQKNSKIQRSWLYGEDQGIKARENFQYQDAVPQEDNELSLPLGRGEYFTNPKSREVAGNRHMRTDVTTAPYQHLDCGFRLG